MWQTAHRAGTGTVLYPKPAWQEFAITHTAIRKLGSLGTDRVVVKVKYGSTFKVLMPGFGSHPFGSCSLQESEAPGMSQDGRQDIMGSYLECTLTKTLKTFCLASDV